MNPNADKISIVSGLKLKWAGNIDVADFYQKLKYWLLNSGYGDEMKNFKEIKYVQRIKGDSKEIDVKWTGEKNVSDYFANNLTITMLITKMKDVEIMISGRKVKMNNAAIEIKIFADLIKNRKGRWPKKSMMKSIYENMIIKQRIDEYKMGLYQKAYSLHDEVKTFFDLQKF
jgi:hypothetical protein